MSFAGYFLSVLFCLLSMLISDSRFDLVWFRLSCDHGWIRSGSVNVRKQQNNKNNIPFTVLQSALAKPFDLPKSSKYLSDGRTGYLLEFLSPLIIFYDPLRK